MPTPLPPTPTPYCPGARYARTLRERVRRGALLLDVKMPLWYKKIDLRRLDMANGWNCVLGQANDGFWKGLQELWPGAPIEALHCVESRQHPAVRHGFMLETLSAREHYPRYWGALKEYWTAEICQRYNAEAKAIVES